MAKRTIARLQLDASAKQQFERFCNQRDMTQAATLARLLEWFTKQDEVLQASVLGLMSDESLGEIVTAGSGTA